MDWEKFRKDLNEVLADFSEKNGISLSIGTIRYSSSTFDFRVNGVILEGGKDAERIEFEEVCGRYGFKPEDYGKLFTTAKGGTVYRLIGFNPRGRKYKVIMERLSDGKSVKAMLEHLRLMEEVGEDV